MTPSRVIASALALTLALVLLFHHNDNNLHLPSNVLTLIEHGYHCTLESDHAHDDGKDYLNWYCRK